MRRLLSFGDAKRDDECDADITGGGGQPAQDSPLLTPS